jgi:hypothetical protein
MQIFNNTAAFDSLANALETFRCRATVTIIPGTIINFNGQISIVGNVLLLSVNIGTISISITIVDGMITITSTTQIITTITLNQQITISGLYLIFTNVGLQFFVTCPYGQLKPAGVWETTLFKDKVVIETSRTHLIGSASTASLLLAFCNINNVIISKRSVCKNKIFWVLIYSEILQR